MVVRKADARSQTSAKGGVDDGVETDGRQAAKTVAEQGHDGWFDLGILSFMEPIDLISIAPHTAREEKVVEHAQPIELDIDPPSDVERNGGKHAPDPVGANDL